MFRLANVEETYEVEGEETYEVEGNTHVKKYYEFYVTLEAAMKV